MTDLPAVTPPRLPGRRVAISRDDKTLYHVTDRVPFQPMRVIATDLASGQGRVVYESAENVGAMALSPDGRFLAVSALWALVQVGVDGGSPRTIASLPNTASDVRGSDVAWTRDGRTVLLGQMVKPASTIVRVDVASGTVEPTGLAVLFPPRCSLSPDGSRIVLAGVAGGGTTLWAIDNVSAFLKATK